MANWIQQLVRRPASRNPQSSRNRTRLDVLRLEDRITPYTSADVFSEFNAGLSAWSSQAPAVAAQGMGSDVPMVTQNFADQLKVADRLKQVVQAKVADPQAALGVVRTALQQAGWTVVRLDMTPDATGRVFEVSKRITLPFTISFNAGGTNDFSYFSGGVTGELTGRLAGAASPGVLDVTVGVDIVNGNPAFYFGEGTKVVFQNVVAAGTASGKLQIRNLTSVQVRGAVEVKADVASLELRDTDGDHRVRLDDLRDNLLEVVRGDVRGTVKFKNVDFTAKISRLPDIRYKGEFNSTFANGQAGADQSPGVVAPNLAQQVPEIARSFLNSVGNSNILGPIRDKLTRPLPLIKKSILQVGGLDKALSWVGDLLTVSDADLATVGKVQQTLSRLGITLDVSPATVAELVQGNDVNLITFKRNGETSWKPEPYKWVSPDFGFPPIVSGNIGFEAGIEGGWSWEVKAGISTRGIWIGDTTGVDVTFTPWVRVTGNAKVLNFIKVAKLSGESKFAIKAYAHLDDPSPGDGKVYLNEIVSDRGNLLRSIINSFDAGVEGGVNLNVQATVKLGFKTISRPILNKYIPLFNFVRKARYGVVSSGAQPDVPMSFANGVLSITGTEGNDRVQLSGSADTVVVQVLWKDASGQSHSTTREFSGVSSVRFVGGDGNDALEAATAFALPISADGGLGNDTLQGWAANDTLLAGPNGDDDRDTLAGGGGDDTLSGNDGNDLLQGQDGNDTLTDLSGDNTFDGGAGNDTLTDGPGDSRLNGGDGDDTVTGGDGNNTADLAAGNDRFVGGRDADDVSGGTGNDSLTLGDGENIAYGGEGNDTLVAGNAKDLLGGDAGDDVVTCAGGDDTVLAGAGNDRVDAGLGDDFVAGEEGNDSVTGGEGNDLLQGGDGLDTLRGGRGDDALDGGGGTNVVAGEEGEDLITISAPEFGGGTADQVTGGIDKDTLAVVGTAGDDIIVIRQITPRRYGVAFWDPHGSWSVEVLVDLPADVELFSIAAGEGNDRITAAAGVTKNLIFDGGDGNDVLIGGGGNDTLRGGDSGDGVDGQDGGNDVLSGRGGSDDIRGGGGKDTIDGGAGSDNLVGDDGNDVVRGGGDHDLMSGGGGNDRLEAGPGVYGVLANGDAGDDTMVGGAGVDVLMGDEGRDVIVGGDLLDVLIGGAGDDTLAGETGRDFLFGESGNDLLRAEFDAALRQQLGLTPLVSDSQRPWTEQYQSMLDREVQVFNRIKDLETRKSAGGLSEEEEEELQRLSDELAVIDLVQVDINPYQRVQVDLLFGEDGDDVFWGSQYPDLLFGGAGDDLFHHTAGGDTVQGGDGNRDVYTVDGHLGRGRHFIPLRSDDGAPRRGIRDRERFLDAG